MEDWRFDLTNHCGLLGVLAVDDDDIDAESQLLVGADWGELEVGLGGWSESRDRDWWKVGWISSLGLGSAGERVGGLRVWSRIVVFINGHLLQST